MTCEWLYVDRDLCGNSYYPDSIYLLKVNNRNTTTKVWNMFWRRFGVFIINFEHISHLCSSASIVNFEHVNCRLGNCSWWYHFDCQNSVGIVFHSFSSNKDTPNKLIFNTYLLLLNIHIIITLFLLGKVKIIALWRTLFLISNAFFNSASVLLNFFMNWASYVA